MTDEERRELAALRESVSALERELGRLRQRVDAFATGEPAAPPPAQASNPPPPPTAPDVVVSPAAHFRPQPPRRSRRELPPWLRAFLTEGNPLNKLGALSLIVGAAVVFKYAVDNQWIGPTGRVGLGFATGAALLAAGEVYARKRWLRFASGLVAGGDGLLFVAIYFGHQQYGVIPTEIAFLLYVVVTAAVAAQSLRYDAEALAVWGLLGGYLAPALASTGDGNYVFLSSYLLVLNGGVFAIAYAKSWNPLKWMAFAITVAYTGLWVFAYASKPGDTRWLALHWLLPYLAAFFVSFALIPTWRCLRLRIPIDRFGQILTVANGVVHFGFAVVALHDEHRAWLGLVAVVVGALYAAVSANMVREPALDAAGLRVFTGTAAAFLLLATPYLASGPAITLVWCAETVALAWGCTRPQFAFLRLHVLAMLVVIGVRLIEWDGLFYPQWNLLTGRYVPFAQLESWPPFAAALTFALVGRLAGRIPNVRFPSAGVMVLGLLVAVAAVDGEAHRLARGTLAPLASPDVHDLIEAGILVAVMGAVWWIAFVRFAASAAGAWLAGAVLATLLAWWSFEALLWPGGYHSMLRSLGAGFGLWWLHLGTWMLVPLLLMLAWLGREVPEDSFGLRRDRLQALLFLVALGVAMLLLRREVFAITHAPPLMDLFPDGARRAAYRSILSLAYALLAFGVYLDAVRKGRRAQLRVAYALYAFTAFKVYFFDLESQNQLYRAFSLLVFAAITFVSSWFANRQERAQHA